MVDQLYLNVENLPHSKVAVVSPLSIKTLLFIYPAKLELVSKELNHLAAILHAYAGSLIGMKQEKYHYSSKRKGKYFYTFIIFIVKSLQKEHKSTTMTPNLPE